MIAGYLTLSSPRSSIDDLVFSVFTSNFFKLSYKISLLKNRFVTLFFIRFSYNFQKITLIFSRIGTCVICALILRFYTQNGSKHQQPSCRRQNRPNSQHVPTTLKSNSDYIFTTIPNPLSLTQSENYSFGASFDKISSDNNNFYAFEFPNVLGVSKPPQTNLNDK